MSRLLIAAIIVWGVGISHPAWGQEPASKAEAIYSFAEHLFATGEYYRAITEYKRLLFLYPKRPKEHEIQLRIGDCYLKGERWDDALKHFQSLLILRLPAKIQSKLLYKIAKAYYAKGEYVNARRQLEALIDQFPESQDVNQAYYLTGQCYLRQDKWAKAADAFSRISEGIDAKGLSLEAEEGDSLPYKSPGLAGTLSAIVPGLGQLYAGRKQDAFMAFLLNGLFIWGVVESFEHDKEVAGGILLFFELGWYGGNIFSAMSSTHKYNKKLGDDFRKGLESRFQFNVGSLEGDVKQPYIGLTYRF